MTTPTTTQATTTTPFKNTAMNKLTSTQVATRLCSAHADITAMTNIVKLAQFAAEARRTLQGINDLGRLKPEVEAVISKHVEASHEWEMCEDVLGQVLNYAINRLERAQDEMERMERMLMAMTDSAQDGEVTP